jgi:multiple sugar transport system substrate-binding protein
MTITRRASLAVGAALLLAPRRPRAQASAVTILGHRVHKAVAEGTQGGSSTADWAKANGATIEWLTFDTGPLTDRLFREASLPSTNVDVAYLLNTLATPTTMRLLQPLDAFQAATPIEDFADFFRPPIEAVTRDGKLFAIPMRHATAGLHYNAEFFQERGLSGPPRTMEELFEYARKLTYTRPNGQRVVGFAIPNNYSNVVSVARAWNGDFISDDYRAVAHEAPMVKTITALRELVVAGAFPRDFPGIMQEELNVWMQQGRAAMTITSMSRNAQFNDPQRSRFPGKFVTTVVPVAEEMKGKLDVAPVSTEFWSFIIPANARRKDVSWSLIRAMSSRENTRRAALNGNGPMRNSLYDDPAYTGTLPYAEAERRTLKVARPSMPAFDEAARATDVIREQYEAAMLGFKPVQVAMDDLSRRLTELLPKS